jgi:hypothetical protein
VFIVTPLVDVLANVKPLHFGVMEWRFGAAGVASNYLISVVFGATLAALVAVASGRRLTLWVLGVAGSVAALALIVAGVYVVLDMFQLSAQVPPESLNAFETGGWKTFFKLLSTALVLAALGLAELKTALARGRAEVPASPLVMGEKRA